MHWFVLAFSAVLCFTAYDLLSRVFGNKSKDPQAFSALYNSIATLVAVVFFLLTPSRPSHITPLIWLLTAAGLFVWAIFGRLEWIAHKYIEASALTILERFAYVVSFAIGIVFLNETASPVKLLSLIFIVTAMMILVRGTRMKSNPRMSFLGIVLSIALGLGWVFDKLVSSSWGISLFVIASFAAPALFNMCIPPISKKTLIAEWKNTNLWIVVLAILNVAGYYLMLNAFAVGQLSSVILVISLTHAFALIGGIVLLKEREDVPRKLIAGSFSFLAAMLLGIWG